MPLPGFQVDVNQPINWENPLNSGLVCTYRTLPYGVCRSRTTVKDLVKKSGKNLTFVGDAAYGGSYGRPGGFGSTIYDGTGDYATRTEAVITGLPMTICAWVRPTSLAANGIITGMWADQAGTWYARYLIMGSNGRASATTVTDNVFSGATVTAGHAISANQWVFITGVWFSTTDRNVYQNGVFEAQNTTSSDPGTLNRTMIGAEYFANGGQVGVYFTGAIDGVRYYNRGLSADEILALYNDEINGCPNTLNWISPKRYYFISGNTYNETGSGGVKCGGTAYQTYDQSGSGGTVCNSTATIQETCNVTASGGIVCNSTSNNSEICQEISMGGMVCNGSTDIIICANVNGTGGIACNSSGSNTVYSTDITSGGILCNSIALNTVYSTDVGIGGILCNSIALNTVYSTDIVASGGILCNSIALNTVYSTDIVASGGILCNSIALNTVYYTNIVTGGTLCDSTSSLVITKNIIATGGAIVNSTADFHSIYQIGSNGGIVVSGNLAGFIYNIIASGGIIIQGDTIVHAIYKFVVCDGDEYKCHIPEQDETCIKFTLVITQGSTVFKGMQNGTAIQFGKRRNASSAYVAPITFCRQEYIVEEIEGDPVSVSYPVLMTDNMDLPKTVSKPTQTELKKVKNTPQMARLKTKKHIESEVIILDNLQQKALELRENIEKLRKIKT